MPPAPNARGVGLVVKAARKRVGWTIKEAAEKAGVSPTTWSRAEDGRDVRRESWGSINELFALPEGTMWNYLTIPDGPVHLAQNMDIATAVVDLSPPDARDDDDRRTDPDRRGHDPFAPPPRSWADAAATMKGEGSFGSSPNIFTEGKRVGDRMREHGVDPRSGEVGGVRHGDVVGTKSIELLGQLWLQSGTSEAEERLIHALLAVIAEHSGASVAYTGGTRSFTMTKPDPETGEPTTTTFDPAPRET